MDGMNGQTDGGVKASGTSLMINGLRRIQGRVNIRQDSKWGKEGVNGGKGDPEDPEHERWKQGMLKTNV